MINDNTEMISSTVTINFCTDVQCPTDDPCITYYCFPFTGQCVVSDFIQGCCSQNADCPTVLNSTLSSFCGEDNRCYLVGEETSFTQSLQSNLQVIEESVSNITQNLNQEDVPQYYWTAFLSVDGVSNLNQDYSVNPRTAWTANELNHTVIVNRMLVQLLGNGAVRATGYGTLPTLPVGISITYEREDGVLVDLTADHNIQSNIDYAVYAFNGRRDAFGSGADGYSVEWNFGEGDPSGLTLQPTKKIRAMLRDDFSGLLVQRFLVQGYELLDQ